MSKHERGNQRILDVDLNNSDRERNKDFVRQRLRERGRERVAATGNRIGTQLEVDVELVNAMAAEGNGGERRGVAAASGGLCSNERRMGTAASGVDEGGGADVMGDRALDGGKRVNGGNSDHDRLIAATSKTGKDINLDLEERPSSSVP